ncbi:relaxase/mobilization nuclease domain-containing protein [Pseudooceanicola atlanticus]|uniref:relaxase/mobilization nuclease domain-containing protein n=1 Tax=Pseudooceanicola atlanticus TaxID=1461694 RepID=UPI002357D6EF|nr:relaxase [Pseudooceanicola atlanticus]
MILVGNQRGGWRDLARHLQKDENERVEVHELRGFASTNLDDAFQESYAVSRATRCKQHLYSLSLNPPKEAEVSDEQFRDAIERAENRLGLSGQPRAIVFHEKKGEDGQVRRHAHAVWCRIDAENARAVHLSYPKQKLQGVARELYLEHGWTMPRGFVEHEARDPRNYSLEEWQQAKRAKRDPKELKGQFQEAWAISDSRQAFEAALKERGFFLARGDRRGYVAVDHTGEVFAIAKWASQKTKDVRARLGDAQELPTIGDARDKAAARVAERLEELRREEETRAKERLERIAKVQLDLKIRQDREGQRLDTAQDQRRASEEAQREAKLRKGLMGLVDRLMGRRRRQEEENRREAAQAAERDLCERQSKAAREAQLRAAFAAKAQEREQRRAAIAKELGDDIAELRKPADRDERRQQYEMQRSERPRRPRRGRARDGPAPER